MSEDMAPTCFQGRGMSIQQATDLWPAPAGVSICLQRTLLLVINITRTPLPTVSPAVHPKLIGLQRVLRGMWHHHSISEQGCDTSHLKAKTQAKLIYQQTIRVIYHEAGENPGKPCGGQEGNLETGTPVEEPKK